MATERRRIRSSSRGARRRAPAPGLALNTAASAEPGSVGAAARRGHHGTLPPDDARQAAINRWEEHISGWLAGDELAEPFASWWASYTGTGDGEPTRAA